MIARLFGRKKERAPAAAVAEDCRIYAVGDVHGRADLLRELHRRILADAEVAGARRKVVVYVGDYVDRGLHSREVIDMLLDEPLPGFESVHLKGNHEQFLLVFLEDASVGPPWLANGGNATLFSYGVSMGEEPAMDKRLVHAQGELREKLPARHRDFLENLRLWHREGDYLFVHAGIRPGVPLERQDPEDLMWIRDEFLGSSVDHGMVVVHGHSISEEPDVRRNRIGIDTAAFATGMLTALVLQGQERGFIVTD